MAADVQHTQLEPTLQQATVESYEGDRTESGLFHGQGRAVFVSGQVYEGSWSEGDMHGSGRLEWPDGLWYEGDMQTSSATGSGACGWPNCTYEGGVLDGKRHGWGRLTFHDSDAVYEGEWRDGLRHGQGTLYFDADRTCYYQGEWVDDAKHGGGTMRYPSGNTYTGQWHDDQKEGYGVMEWADRQQVYRGQWHNNVQNGLGEHTWQQQQQQQQLVLTANHALIMMCNRYHGLFVDGMRHGEGTLFYATGARYEGQWTADKKHGEGVFVFEDGSVFEGCFEDDRPLLDSRAPGSAAAPLGAAGGAGGFSPALSQVQLNIGELLREEQSPEVAAKLVPKLLVNYNTELRALYDKYSKRITPFLPACGPPRSSFALTTAQFWELARECNLLCRHMSLAQLNELLLAARTPPPAVLARRERVLASEHAEAVLVENVAVHSPRGELLYRDFCEALVRIAHRRYPQLPSLERRLQQLIAQDLLPGQTPSRRAPLPPSTPSAAMAATAAAGSAAAPQPHELLEQLQAADAVEYLQQHEGTLCHIFADMVHGRQPWAGTQESNNDNVSSEQCGDDNGCASSSPVCAAEEGQVAVAWRSSVPVGRIVHALQAAGVIREHLTVANVMQSLLGSCLTAKDPQALRLRMDVADSEEPGEAEADQPDKAGSTTQASPLHDLIFWSQACLTFAEFVWGIARCAMLVADCNASAAAAAAVEAAEAEDSSHHELLAAAESATCERLSEQLALLLEGRTYALLARMMGQYCPEEVVEHEEAAAAEGQGVAADVGAAGAEEEQGEEEEEVYDEEVDGEQEAYDDGFDEDAA